MMVAQQQKMMQNSPGITLQDPGKPPRTLNLEETLKLIQNQQQDLQLLAQRNQELEQIVVELQTQIIRLSKMTSVPIDAPNPTVVIKERLKSEPDITISI
jgi:hypothetical protein